MRNDSSILEKVRNREQNSRHITEHWGSCTCGRNWNFDENFRQFSYQTGHWSNLLLPLEPASVWFDLAAWRCRGFVWGRSGEVGVRAGWMVVGPLGNLRYLCPQLAYLLYRPIFSKVTKFRSWCEVREKEGRGGSSSSRGYARRRNCEVEGWTVALSRAATQRSISPSYLKGRGGRRKAQINYHHSFLTQFWI